MPESARDSGSQGRHAAGSRPVRRPVAPTRTLEALPVELPVIVAGSQIDRAEVEVLADRMLGHLAVEEQRSTVLDPADLPGGKWAFIGGGALAVLALLIIISIVVTAFTNR